MCRRFLVTDSIGCQQACDVSRSLGLMRPVDELVGSIWEFVEVTDGSDLLKPGFLTLPFHFLLSNKFRPRSHRQFSSLSLFGGKMHFVYSLSFHN